MWDRSGIKPIKFQVTDKAQASHKQVWLNPYMRQQVTQDKRRGSVVFAIQSIRRFAKLNKESNFTQNSKF
jgi:hypothetical protein